MMRLGVPCLWHGAVRLAAIIFLTITLFANDCEALDPRQFLMVGTHSRFVEASYTCIHRTKATRHSSLKIDL